MPPDTDLITVRESTDLRNEIRSLTVTLRDEMRALDTSVRAQANRLDDNFRALERTTHTDNERTRDKVDTTLRWLITTSVIFGFGLTGILVQVVRLPH